MALAKYAEEIEEAIFERMAMREQKYCSDFRTAPSEIVTSRSKQERGEHYKNTFTTRSDLNNQIRKENLYVG